ncbi:MAG: ABC-type transport auxiliary lipoprotein family protein [Caulobacterales bacterium]
MIRPATRVLAVAAATLALGGCITLFPKATPAPLYRFGEQVTAAQAPSDTHFAVLDDTLGFDRTASTDRILTINGNEVAYIKDARWAVAAPLMFHTAVQHAFDSAGGPARLIERGEAWRPDYVMKVDVLRFEARYDHGAGAAPTIVVRLRATLNKGMDHALVGDRLFEASIAASDNRVGPITEAFDQATSKVLTDLVAWVDQAGTT